MDICLDKCECGRTKNCGDNRCIACICGVDEALKGLTAENVEQRMKPVYDKAAQAMFGSSEEISAALSEQFKPLPVDLTSKRYNQGKIQTREIDPAFILGIGEVLTKSREKYAEGNWMKDTKYSVPYESLQRHLAAFWSGDEIDKESGCHHLLHCATNIMFLYYHVQQNKPESDDRLFKKKKPSGNN
jgi:hypothetical protein